MKEKLFTLPPGTFVTIGRHEWMSPKNRAFGLTFKTNHSVDIYLKEDGSEYGTSGLADVISDPNGWRNKQVSHGIDLRYDTYKLPEENNETGLIYMKSGDPFGT